MKSNHIPRSDRLRTRISQLEARREGSLRRVGSNPYPFCTHCNASIVEINTTGHRSGCPLRGLDKQIAYYRGLLA